MPQIPRVSQVPIIEPMYTNGVMNPTWVRFFEKLASMLNVGDLADSLTLLQLANQLPTQAALGQLSMDMPTAQFDMVAVPVMPNEMMPTITTFIPQTTTFDMVAMPTSEIIAHDSISKPI